MNKKRMEGDFKRGSKTSSSLMATDITDEQVAQFMRTSFYLPVDILRHKDWVVSPIRVMTGEEFKKLWEHAASTVGCVEDVQLLLAAQYVAVSMRKHKHKISNHIVAKLWYGEAP